MSKIKMFTVFSCFVFISLGVISQRKALACELAGFSNYIEIGPNVFISSQTPKNNHQEILSIISAGKARITETYGAMTSAPKIVIPMSISEASKLAINSIGQTHFTPISQCVVLGPEGQNIDVAAHELLHAEVIHRVGWINYTFSIPIWFGEGIATIVDHREHLLVENISLTKDKVMKVQTKGFDFFADGNIYENYLAARLAVDSIDRASLYKKLAKIREGEKFHDVYNFLN